MEGAGGVPFGARDAREWSPIGSTDSLMIFCMPAWRSGRTSGARDDVCANAGDASASMPTIANVTARRTFDGCVALETMTVPPVMECEKRDGTGSADRDGGQHAAHVGHRLDHPRQRVLGIDLVLEPD